MARYLATKEGWDGRRIVKEGTVFNFDGPKGSWMVPCDDKGNPLKADAIVEQRPVRAGSKTSNGVGGTRESLRARCKELGIKFAATLGAQDLAELIQKHEAGIAQKNETRTSSENPDGGAPGVGEGATQETPAGTGNLEVL